MDFLRKIFVHSPVHYIAAFLVAVAAAVYRFVTLPDGVGLQLLWYEMLSVSGMVTFLIGGLLAVAYFGAFDIFTYAFTEGPFNKNRKYKSYAHYSQAREASRTRANYYFLPYFIVGLVVYLMSYLFV